MVQRTIGADLEDGIDRACSGIRCTINQPFDACIDDRAGAHRAWFYCYVESRIGETIVSYSLCRITNRQYLSMRRGIIHSDRLIMSDTNQLIINYHGSADRDFTGIASLPGFDQRKPHKKPVERVRIHYIASITSLAV